MLLWLENAPLYDATTGNNEHEICDFIDAIITCTTNYSQDEDMLRLVSLQKHKHTHTCKKNRKGIKCRFNIPFFPTKTTCMLHPLEDEHPHLKHLQLEYACIEEILEKKD